MKTSYGLSAIWLIFAIFFLVLATLHYSESENKIAHFQVSERPVKGTNMKVLGKGVDEPLKDFARDFNSYLDKYNESSYKQNIYAAVGYFAAALIAIFSMWSEFRRTNGGNSYANSKTRG